MIKQVCIWFHEVTIKEPTTWDTKGATYIHVFGMDGKKQITIEVSSSAKRKYLPLQNHCRTIGRSLIPTSNGHAKCKTIDFYFINTRNHQSTLNLYKQLIEKIMLPYYKLQCKVLNLPMNQKLMQLIDSWNVHLSLAFCETVNAYPWIYLKLYIPTKCTSVMQSTNVMLQKPFKHTYKREFSTWTCNTIKTQFDKGITCEVDLGVQMLKTQLLQWLFTTWSHICSMN